MKSIKATPTNQPTKTLNKGGGLRMVLGIFPCYIEQFLCSRRLTGNREQVFVCHNGGCAYANGCDVSAGGLDMLELVDLLLVGDDPN